MKVQRPKHLGVFKGGNLGKLNYEVFSIQYFSRHELDRDAALNESKWFDYRSMHHLQATYYFVDCYNKAIQRDYAKRIDRDRAPYIRVFGDVDFLSARERAVMYRLRQLVDTMGVPYDFFLNFAMNWNYRIAFTEGRDKIKGKGKIRGEWHLPRPGHLVKNEKMITDAMLAWEDLCAASMQYSKDHYFRVDNWVGSKSQIAHEAWVIGQIKGRKNPVYSLSNALYISGVVRPEEALRQFDSRTISEAIKHFHDS